MQAQNSIAHRIVPRVDSIRQIATKLGVRPYRVSLVWGVFAGDERGEGAEVEVKRIEILPTPRILPFRLEHSMFPIGWVPSGILRVKLISATLTEDMLLGKWVPNHHEIAIPQPYSFHYEIVEDGRGDATPRPRKYRLSGAPYRAASSVMWEIVLERIGTDNDMPSTGPGINPCR